MKKIKYARLILEGALTLEQVPAFRAAIARTARHHKELFHHHEEENKLLYRYPLIQFKSLQDAPAVVALEQGAEALMEFLEHKPSILRLHHTTLPFKVSQIHLRQHLLQVWNKSFPFSLQNWLALNKDNLARYRSTPSLVERVRLLERILTAHILAFAEGVQWNVEKTIQVTITHIHRQRLLKYKRVNWQAFDLTFLSNVSLPEAIGLGKSPSVGFGIVRRMRTLPSKDEGSPQA
ncbi:MAG: CRISPR-associated endonuclease Cas6 [Flavobacteriales bacterium]|nr:CRISPR-associated endonuclease Cas6 [Flavobacteriales bacterium]MDW8410995.1 CRISPR-associated endonuclease Cas6 [Flavobacteriales bacterium]